MRGCVFAVLVVALSAAPALACDGELMQGSTANAPEARILLEPPQISHPFAVRVALCDGGQVLTVDAIMPAHQHGMLYRPSMSALGQSRYIAENLVFHMPGLWHIQVQAEVDARRIDYVYETVVQ